MHMYLVATFYQLQQRAYSTSLGDRILCLAPILAVRPLGQLRKRRTTVNLTISV